MVRPGRRRALAGLLAGAVTLMHGHRPLAAARKKKKGKRSSAARCPDPPACPALDTCPVRSCCVCVNPSPTLGCRTVPVRSDNLDQLHAACEQACGGPGTAGAQFGTVPGQSLVCNESRTACQRAACPL
jgi:hypothetical protein